MTILRVDTIAGTGTTFGPLLDGNLEFNSQNYIVLPKGSSNQQGVLRTTEDVIGVGGTYYDNLVLAMPFNEATGLRDVSSRNRNPGAYGNVAISTAQSKYYGSSVGFSSITQDYLIYQTNLVFGTGNFTVEGWVNMDYSSSASQIHGSSNNDFNLFIGTDGNLRFWDATGVYNLSSSSISLNTWTHFAVVREGTGTNQTKIYVNGINTNNITLSKNWTTAIDIFVGKNHSSGTSYANGYIQDLRIYKGIAKYTANFTPPERIAETGVGFKTGALRYNTDSNKPELYDGNQWTELQISNVGLGTAGDTGPGARGVFGGGVNAPTTFNTIEYINISSTGNAQDFGDLNALTQQLSSCSSSTRGVFGGGYVTSASVNTISFVTISSTGDAQDFGDLNTSRFALSACSSSTRGIFGAGCTVAPATYTNTIEYITISSTGSAQDFGDSIVANRSNSSCSSPTRGIFAGGRTPSTINTIEFITISTLGDAQDFGDLTVARDFFSACSNKIRGLFGGGPASSKTNTIDFITISTIGNAINFGDLTYTVDHPSSLASSTRGLWGGGDTPSTTNTINYVTILTQGDAVDFGDLTEAKRGVAGLSNAHGGL